MLTLVLLATPPAAAKGPTQVEVHDLRTGSTTLLDFLDRGEMGALEGLVGWPERLGVPRGVEGGGLEHVATLTWEYGDDMPAWIDRIYTDGTGPAWVERRDHLSGSGSAHWGRLSGYAFEAVLAAIQEHGDPTSGALRTQPAPASDPTAPFTTADSTRDQRRQTPSGGLDARSLAWGAGLTALLAGVLLLIARLRPSRSTRAAD